MFFKIPFSAYIYSAIATILSLLIFFYSSFFEQMNQILGLSLGVGEKVKAFFELTSGGVSAMGAVSALLLALWVVSLFIFYSTFFGLIKVKQKYKAKTLKVGKSKNSILGAVSFFLSWISFGCVACGQAILTSIISIFVTQLSVGLLHNVVFVVLIISIVILLVNSYNNYKLLSHPDVCPI